MKKWLVIFTVSIYSVMPATSLHPGLGLVSVFIALVAGCFNIANAIIMQRNPIEGTEISMKSIMIVKLFLLPVYTASFAALIVMGLMALSIWFTIPAIAAIPVIIVYSYFVLLTSSSMAISRIIILYRRGVFSIGQCVVHIVLQLFFVTDVIDSIVVSRKERRSA